MSRLANTYDIMRRIIPILAAIALLGFPIAAYATPISWDFANNIIQPLISGATALIKGNHFQATSTSQASIFPLASTTITSATTLCLSADCRTVWPSGSGGSGTISTSSPLVSGQPLYATGLSTIASIASSTFLTSIGGQSALNFPLNFSQGGTNTTSPGSVGQIIFNNGTSLTGSTTMTYNINTGYTQFSPLPGSSTGGFVVNYNQAAAPNIPHSDSIHIVGDDNDFGAVYVDSFHFRSLLEGRVADGTLASSTNTKAGSEMLRVAGRAYGASGYTNSLSAISMLAAQDISDTAQGSWIGFRSTALNTIGGGSQAIPPINAAITPSGGLLLGASHFTYSPSNFAFYDTEPGNGNILANGITIANATSTNATTTSLAILNALNCNTSSALTTNSIGQVVCGAISGGGSGSGNVATSSSETAGYFPVWTSTNGTPALLAGTSNLFQNGNNIGIGTTSPFVPLDIAANGSAVSGQLALTDTNAGTGLKHWLLSSQGGNFYLGTTTNSYATSTPSVMSINNAGNIAIGTTINTNIGVSIGYTSTSGTGLKQALSAGSTYTGSNANAQTVSGSYTSTYQGTVNNTSSGGAAAIGGRFNAVNNATGLNALNLYGVFSAVTNNGAFSSTTNAVTFFGSPPTAPATTTITNFYGLRISGNATEAGSIVSGAGIDVDNLLTIATNTTEALLGTNTIPSGRFGIYQSDSNNDYFAGNIGLGTTSPMSQLAITGDFNQYGSGFAHFGSLASRDTTYCVTGKMCVGLFGSDNTLSGVNMEVGNYSRGASAYSVFALVNDLDDSTGTHYGALSFNSSIYSDTTFGTGLALPSQLQLGTSDGRITLWAASTTDPVINFLVGGTASGNEIARFTTTGLGIGTTTPGSLLSIGGAGSGWNFYNNATSTKNGIGGININDGCYAFKGVCLSAGGAVSSVSNADGTLTISPTTGAVVSSLNLAHANTWTALQQFSQGATTTNLGVTGKIFVSGNSFVDTSANILQWSTASLFPQGTGHLGDNVHPWTDFAVTGFVIDSTGHVITSGTKPTLSSCGSTNVVSGNDNNGTIMFTGTLVTACTMTFATPVPAGQTLECQASDGSTAFFTAITATSTTAVTFSTSASLSAGTIFYDCKRHQ